jgi:hypothetical protein
MKLRSLWMAGAFAVVAPAAAQNVAGTPQPEIGTEPPTNNFIAAVNGMARLCPGLVRGGTVPDESAATPWGLRPVSSPAGQHRFQSTLSDGMLQIWFEPSRQMCTVHYGGAGFHAIAGFARDFVTENGFRHILSDSRSRGDVYVRPLDQGHRAQYIIVEDSSSQTAAVSYAERLGS